MILLKIKAIAVLLLLPLLLISQSEVETQSRMAMGTTFRIIIKSQKDKSSALEAAFAEIDRINKIFSTYDKESEVSILNHSENWLPVSPELLELIIFSEELRNNSQGAFDIRIGQSTKAWKDAFENDTLPSKANIDIKRKIYVDEDQVKTNESTSLDFGAIAKGYAVDKAFMKLKEMGFDTVLVDGGGDIRLGKSISGRGWKIAQHYEEGKILWLEDISIATSGPDYQNIEIGDRKQSHIIDPNTLDGISEKIGVTIMSKTCTIADALATAVTVLGQIDPLVEHYEFKANIKKGDRWVVKHF